MSDRLRIRHHQGNECCKAGNRSSLADDLDMMKAVGMSGLPRNAAAIQNWARGGRARPSGVAHSFGLQRLSIVRLNSREDLEVVA